MKLPALLELLKERGCTPRVENGRIRIKGPKDAVTTHLVRVLKLRKEELLAHLAPTALVIHQPPSEPAPMAIPAEPQQLPAVLREAKDEDIELRWPGNGYIGRLWFPEQGWPIGAHQWRYVGETEWRDIPEADRPKIALPVRAMESNCGPLVQEARL